MASPGRRPRSSLIEELYRRPYRFRFFQAARILERAGRREAENPRYAGRSAVGGDAEPRREAVRFRAPPSLEFPPAEVAALHEPAAPEGDGADAARRPPGPPELAVTFLGLTGPSGMLPQHYTELLIRDLRGKSTALRDFLDLFNHRIISLFLRAWEKYRLAIAYERWGAGGHDPISGLLFSLVGFGTGHLRGRLAADPEGRPLIDDEALLHYCGHLAHWPRSAAALEALLTDYFERPIRVDQFQGRWLTLSDAETSSFPTAAEPDGRFCRLGVDAVSGNRVWDVQSSFRIRIGPLGYDQFLRFMPDGDELIKLAHLTRLYVGPGMSFDVQLTLRREEVPFLNIGGEEPARLGWNTWVKHEEFGHDPDDAVYILDNL